MGFVGGVVGGYNEAGEKGHAARMKRAEGLAAKNAAYSKAGKVERGAAARLEVAGENLSRLKSAQNAEKGALRAFEATRGAAITSRDGSNERALDAMYETMASDLQQDASVGSLNAYNEAVAMRQSGNLADYTANAEADMLASMAKRQRVGAFMGGVVGVAGTIGGALAARDYNEKNAADIAAGKKEAMNPLLSGLQFGRVGSSFAWSMDPQMSKYASDGWEKDFLSLLQDNKKK